MENIEKDSYVIVKFNKKEYKKFNSNLISYRKKNDITISNADYMKQMVLDGN